MTVLTIELAENEYNRLKDVAEKAGKTVKVLVEDWISQLPNDQIFDVKNDPLFTIEGFDSEAPSNLSTHIDSYLYDTKKYS